MSAISRIKRVGKILVAVPGEVFTSWSSLIGHTLSIIAVILLLRLGTWWAYTLFALIAFCDFCTFIKAWRIAGSKEQMAELERRFPELKEPSGAAKASF